MRVITILALIGAVLSFILGVISRLMLVPLNILPGGIEASTFLDFTDTCFGSNHIYSSRVS